MGISLNTTVIQNKDFHPFGVKKYRKKVPFVLVLNYYTNHLQRRLSMTSLLQKYIHFNPKVEINFNGGELTSDAGL